MWEGVKRADHLTAGAACFSKTSEVGFFFWFFFYRQHVGKRGWNTRVRLM